MATDPRYQRVGNGHSARNWEDLAIAEDHAGWVARSRVMLTPIAAPSIMGLFGFTIATVMLGAYQAGWYGNATTTLIIWLAAGAMVLEHSFGRTIIPVGKWSRTANIPGVRVAGPIGYPAGMPGVRVGQ